MKTTKTEIGPVTNAGADIIASGQPYQVIVTIKGTSDLLFHRWNVEGVAEKAAAAKGSKEKKSDNTESYLYRDDDGYICLPGEYLRQAVIHAAKFRQDPRSPRKSAMDLYKAGIVALTTLAPIGPKRAKEPEFLHQCRVQVQRNGVTRTRPAFHSGWEATVTLACLLPEYIKPADMNEMIAQAGRLIGVGDFRPTYGRFQIIKFEIGPE